jgi:enoyl-CoA hydratase/carnithine racemase
MSYSTIRYEVQDGISLLTLSRPDAMNAFTTQMGEEMADAFDRSDADPSVRAMVVTGEGRAFCAGADLSLGAETFNAVARPRPKASWWTPIRNGAILADG